MKHTDRDIPGLLLGLTLLPLAFAGTVSAAVSSRTVNEGGKELVVIASDSLELTFEPARGGRCTRFVFKDNGEQIIGGGEVCGMFLDHWAKYTWPSGLMWLPYQYELVGDGTTQVGIRLWVKVPELGGGKGDLGREASLKMPTSPDLIGLMVRKTIWLQADTDLIRVEQEVANPTGKSRAAALYVQHNLELGGGRYGNTWYLPSTRGLEYHILPDSAEGRTIGSDWVLDPTGSWMAVRNRRSNRGLLFAFDYNYLQKIYTCGTTAEWFFEPVPIGPGKSFRTEHVIKPVRGFEDYVYGSRRVVADLRADEITGGRVRVQHDLAAVSGELRDVEIELQVSGWKSKERVGDETYRTARLGTERQRHEFAFTPAALADGVVIAATVRVGGQEERYEYYYAGDREEHERRYGYFATKGGALPGAKGDAYSVKPPRKRKTYDKPDFAAVPRPDPARFRVLVVFGLYTHILNLDDALAGWKSKGGRAAEFMWANCPPNAVETFPGSYEELFAYHVVVLSDVNFKALGDTAFEMVCDYVEQGGALLVAGGPYALGNGEFEGTRFLDVLPARLSGPFDLKWAGKGKSWNLEPADAKSPLLVGVSFEQQPKVFWHHFVTPKPNAKVVLNAGGQPALILGRYGKGKVALLTLSPTGKEAPGEIAWWNWNGWFALVRNTTTWLGQEGTER
jgi:uncharacterized membrane protein